LYQYPKIRSMKVPLRYLLLVCAILSSKAYSQSTPPTIVAPGEYQVFFIKTATNTAYSIGGAVATVGIGSNTGAVGTAIPMAFPAGTQIKQIASSLHNGIAIDMNANAWFWGVNDSGLRADGTVGGAISYSPVQITTDSLGNPFNNLNQVSSWWSETGSYGALACKNDGTVWIWGNTLGGMRGNGYYGGRNCYPVQVNIPGNPHIVKVLAGEICMALDNNGNVYTWGGNGRTICLGTNATDYTTPQKVNLPKPAKDIAGAELFEYALATDGTLYGWGMYGAYLGIGTGPYLTSNTYQPLPVDLTSDLNLPHPVSQIMCNSVSTHVILTDSTLWGWGDNTQGNVGNGIETNWATYPEPYAWDWGPAEVLQHKPVQIMPLVHNFTNLFAGSACCFYMYAEDATGQLYSWGRNKSAVLANQVVGATSDLNASYPDGWDQPTITAVNPFAVTAATMYLSTCPYCLLNPTTSPCSEYPLPANVPPVSVPGPNQTITLPTSTTILDGSGSHDPNGTVVYYKWRQVSGPSVNTVPDSTYARTQITGLVAGTYVYRLTVTDNRWDTNGVTMTVVVQDSTGNVPPTVSAGSAQTIQLPTSSVTLTGTATGNNGATIGSTAWTEVSGPATGVIADAAGLSTGVSGLTVAGTYVFQLKATDNNGNSSTATVVITVEAAIPPAGTPPTVNAGSDQTIQLPTSSATLTGTATGNGGATIASTVWTEISGPATATIAYSAALSTGVSGLTAAGSYVFELKATDNNGLSTTAAVTITVDAAPPHVPPVANAGANQTVTLPFTDITLDGSASYDSDGTITSYSWVQLSGNGGVTIQGSSQVQPAIYGLTPGTYVFQLTVTDNFGATGTATVTITVDAAATVQAPVANAGADTSIALPANSVVLDGSGSTDPGGEALTYQWSQVSGPGTATLGSADNMTTTAGQLQAGLYVFRLTVTNTSGLSNTATVQVRVINNERSADSGTAQVVVYPNPVASTLTIKFTDANTSGQILIKIIDMKGTSVMTEETVVSSGQLINLNVSGLAKGVYAVEVIVGSKLSYQLIVKQ
jgi:alpha-tubulin suppressor-like RCC1 family protein